MSSGFSENKGRYLMYGDIQYMSPYIKYLPKQVRVAQSHGLKNLPLVNLIMYLPKWNGYKLSSQGFLGSFWYTSITHDWLMVALNNISPS